MKMIFILLLAMSCNEKKSGLIYSETNRPSEESSSNNSFKQVKEKVLIPKCITCHGSSNSVNLQDYHTTVKHLKDIERSVLQTKSMPRAPVTPLDEEQLKIFSSWIEAGAPENAADEANEPVLGFNKIKKQIIDTKCISCHKAGEHAAHIPLGTEEELLQSMVVPGDPEASEFYTITAPGARNMMPPIGVDPLTSDEREMVKDWILSLDRTEGALADRNLDIQHEMMLACVSSKKECVSMARREGYRPLRAVRDAARCSGAKPLACIVFH